MARTDKQERAAGEQDRSQADARLRRAQPGGHGGLAGLHGDHHKAEERGTRAGELHPRASAGSFARGAHGHAAEPAAQTDGGAEMGDDFWLISQMKAGAKKETEEENKRKSCGRVCSAERQGRRPELLPYSSELFLI